jgi:hypothetical protein
VDGGLALRPLPMCTDEEIMSMNLPEDESEPA